MPTPNSRILITGVPRSGKTTYSAALSASSNISTVMHTDDLIGKLNWSEASLAVSKWFALPGPWIIEGVAIPRALRKWIEARPGIPPCDSVYWFKKSFLKLSQGQETMAKGCQTVWNEIVKSIKSLGIQVHEASA